MALARFLQQGGVPMGSSTCKERPGGLCLSKTVDGTYDVAGGHILFSKDAHAMQWMKDEAGGDDAFVERTRTPRSASRTAGFTLSRTGSGLRRTRTSIASRATSRRGTPGSWRPGRRDSTGSAGGSATASPTTSWIPTTRRSGSAPGADHQRLGRRPRPRRAGGRRPARRGRHPHRGLHPNRSSTIPRRAASRSRTVSPGPSGRSA